MQKQPAPAPPPSVPLHRLSDASISLLYMCDFGMRCNGNQWPACDSGGYRGLLASRPRRSKRVWPPIVNSICQPDAVSVMETSSHVAQALLIGEVLKENALGPQSVADILAAVADLEAALQGAVTDAEHGRRRARSSPSRLTSSLSARSVAPTTGTCGLAPGGCLCASAPVATAWAAHKPPPPLRPPPRAGTSSHEVPGSALPGYLRLLGGAPDGTALTWHPPERVCIIGARARSSHFTR